MLSCTLIKTKQICMWWFIWEITIVLFVHTPHALSCMWQIAQPPTWSVLGGSKHVNTWNEYVYVFQWRSGHCIYFNCAATDPEISKRRVCVPFLPSLSSETPFRVFLTLLKSVCESVMWSLEFNLLFQPEKQK